MPAQPLVDARQAALAHYGRLVVLAEDAAAGDSGALIVDEGNHPLALLFAGDDRRTLAKPIAAVLCALGMTVA